MQIETPYSEVLGCGMCVCACVCVCVPVCDDVYTVPQYPHGARRSSRRGVHPSPTPSLLSTLYCACSLAHACRATACTDQCLTDASQATGQTAARRVTATPGTHTTCMAHPTSPPYPHATPHPLMSYNRHMWAHVQTVWPGLARVGQTRRNTMCKSYLQRHHRTLRVPIA